jgi:hypothetical protein
MEYHRDRRAQAAAALAHFVLRDAMFVDMRQVGLGVRYNVRFSFSLLADALPFVLTAVTIQA